MLRTLMISAVSAAALTFSAATFAQQGQFGTPQEARAMLDKAVAAVKADQPVALAMFLGTATFIRSVSEAGTGRPSRVRLPFQLARTLKP